MGKSSQRYGAQRSQHQPLRIVRANTERFDWRPAYYGTAAPLRANPAGGQPSPHPRRAAPARSPTADLPHPQGRSPASPRPAARGRRAPLGGLIHADRQSGEGRHQAAACVWRSITMAAGWGRTRPLPESGESDGQPCSRGRGSGPGRTVISAEGSAAHGRWTGAGGPGDARPLSPRPLWRSGMVRPGWGGASPSPLPSRVGSTRRAFAVATAVPYRCSRPSPLPAARAFSLCLKVGEETGLGGGRPPGGGAADCRRARPGQARPDPTGP